MNEIDKLKTEHARYKKALEKLGHTWAFNIDIRETVAGALNPPPSPPVTVTDILTALKNKNRGTALHSIRFYSDESGQLYNQTNEFYAAFYSLREALELLKT